MIKLWTASPRKFDKFDITSIGTGTGIARHGDGMYLGDKKLALEYLKEYEGFHGADRSIIYKGREVDGPAFEVLDYLARNEFDVDRAIEHFAGQEQHLRIAQRPDLLEQVDYRYGMLAEVSIPNVNVEDFQHWDDEIPADSLDSIALTFLTEVTSREQILEHRNQMEDLGIDFDDIETLEELIDELFDLAYEEALESDELGLSVDEEDMRECWNQIVRRDEYSDTDFADEFVQSFPKQHIALLQDLCKDGLTLEKDSQLTYGSLYELTAVQLEQLREQGRELPGLSAPDMMAKFGVDGLRAPAIKAGADSEEVVVYSKELIESAKIRPTLDLSNDFDHEDPGPGL